MLLIECSVDLFDDEVLQGSAVLEDCCSDNYKKIESRTYNNRAQELTLSSLYSLV